MQDTRNLNENLGIGIDILIQFRHQNSELQLPSPVLTLGAPECQQYTLVFVATEARTPEEIQREKESLLLQRYILMLSDAVGKALTS